MNITVHSLFSLSYINLAHGQRNKTPKILLLLFFSEMLIKYILNEFNIYKKATFDL